jgi:hypothetical protein
VSCSASDGSLLLVCTAEWAALEIWLKLLQVPMCDLASFKDVKRIRGMYNGFGDIRELLSNEVERGDVIGSSGVAAK